MSKSTEEIDQFTKNHFGYPEAEDNIGSSEFDETMLLMDKVRTIGDEYEAANDKEGIRFIMKVLHILAGRLDALSKNN